MAYRPIFDLLKFSLKQWTSVRDSGNNYSVCGVSSPEPHAEVFCVRLYFNVSKLACYEALFLSKSFGFSLALHLSSAAGHENCVHILLRVHNADGSIRDCSGQTAHDLSLKPAVQRIFQSVVP